MATPQHVTQFLESMPPRYARRHDEFTARRHAKIAMDRGDRLAHVGWFASSEGPALCVAAPDRPGLLATISAALFLADFDVIAAEAYTRRVAGSADEALDLFWVRHGRGEAPGPLEPTEVHRIGGILVELLGKGSSVGLPRAAATAAAGPSPSTSLRFVEDASGRFVTLEMETGDRSGLLLAVCQALFAERVQIVGSRIGTSGRRVHHRFDLVEFDNSLIAGSRRRAIQVAVLKAIDDASQTAAAPA